MFAHFYRDHFGCGDVCVAPSLTLLGREDLATAAGHPYDPLG